MSHQFSMAAMLNSIVDPRRARGTSSGHFCLSRTSAIIEGTLGYAVMNSRWAGLSRCRQ
jgi:hypothetical protein